jgi:hypothetical protein
MLFVLLDWAAKQMSIAAHDPGSLVRRWLGLTTIALITVIGRTVDSLPLEFLVAARGKAQPNKPAHLARPQRLR